MLARLAAEAQAVEPLGRWAVGPTASMLMRIFTGLSLIGVVLAASPALCAQEVYERSGNIYFRHSNGKIEALTSSAHDHSPALSSDNTEAVFRRELRAAKFDDDGVYQLWTVEISTKRARLLLNSIETGREFAPFGTPDFSPDRRFVYFLIREAQTSLKVMRLNRNSGAIDPVVFGVSEFRVVRKGSYAGYIVACLRKWAFAETDFSFVYWYYLLDSDGREVGFIGREKTDMERFFKALANPK